MKLAVVIPAYKEKYLEQTLQAFASQTCQEFKVYIGDDCSPYQLEPICRRFESRLNLYYTRFDNNIGAKALVKQWSRCISLTQEEPWIWLFSDDDLIDNNCVEKFYTYQQQQRHQSELYRFNNTVIDGNNQELWSHPDSPFYESSELLAYHLLWGRRGNSLADHIFSRRVYERSGGLVYTDYAQGADWAMAILFSQQKGIITIPDARFYWRYSDNNISSDAYSIRNETVEGHLQFLKWVVEHFNYLKVMKQPTVTFEAMTEAALVNFRIIMISHYKGYDTGKFMYLASYIHRTLKKSYFQAFKTLLSIKKATFRIS